MTEDQKAENAWRKFRGLATFDSIEQQRAWEQAVEQSYKIVNRMTVDAGGMRAIAKMAEDGDLIAQGIMNKFVEIRLKG